MYDHKCPNCGIDHDENKFGATDSFLGFADKDSFFCSDRCRREWQAAHGRKQADEKDKEIASFRKKAEKSLKRANKQLAKWQKKVDLIESALESGDDLKALKKAAKATDDPMEMVLGYLFLAGLVWYFCFR